MQHLLIKLAAAAIVAGAAIGSGQAQAGPLPALNDLANQTSQATPVEKAGNYRYRYGGYPYYRPYPYWYYRPRYYGYLPAPVVARRRVRAGGTSRGPDLLSLCARNEVTAPARTMAECTP
jgi:hypothetical protein